MRKFNNSSIILRGFKIFSLSSPFDSIYLKHLYLCEIKKDSQNMRVQVFFTDGSMDPLQKTARHMFVVGNLAVRSSRADGQDVLVQKLENK